MARNFLTPINLNQNELQNARIQNLSTGTAPASPVEGQIYYATDTHLPYVWNGSAWTQMVSTGVTFAAPAFVLGTAAAAGVATTTVRSDATILAFDVTVPTSSAVGDSAAVGSATVAARRDHTHAREAFAAPASSTAFGASAVTGTATTVVHSDHTHGTPTHDAAAHALIHINDLATATGTYNMGGFKLLNVGAATAGTDAASLANRLDQFAAPTSSVSFNSQNITNLLDPTTAQMAATKNYVDTVAQGLSPKGSSMAATTAALIFGPATYANGASGVGATLTAASNGILVVDGYTPVLNDRILVKNEAAPANNGIYTVTTLGTAGVKYILTRSTDMDSAAKYAGAFSFVVQGTTNDSTGWVQVTDPPITVGTTAINFEQFSGAGSYTADGSTLTLTGTQFSINAGYVGQSSIVTVGTITTGTWTGTTIAVANGGTGQTSAANARGTSGLGAQTAPTGAGTAGDVTITAQGIPVKVTAVIGDGAATSITLTHNIGSRDVVVRVYRATTPWDDVECDIQHTSTNVVTLLFSVAPTASQFNVVMVG